MNRKITITLVIDAEGVYETKPLEEVREAIVDCINRNPDLYVSEVQSIEEKVV